MKAGFFKQLCEIAGKENVRTDEPMKQHTTFRIGGAADYFVSPQTTDQIKNIIDLCKSEAMPWYVIGNGSNLLVSDRGFRGVIIQLFKNFSDLPSRHGFLLDLRLSAAEQLPAQDSLFLQ